LQVSIAVFSGAVEKIFGQRWLSSSREKFGPYAYAITSKQRLTITDCTSASCTLKLSRNQPNLTSFLSA